MLVLVRLLQVKKFTLMVILLQNKHYFLVLLQMEQIMLLGRIDLELQLP